MAAATQDPVKLARLHFDTAVALVGAQQVASWVSSAAAAAAPAAGSGGGAGTGRGRKPGSVAAADERCTWTLTDGTQCKNRHQADSTYCRIHLKQVHLVDDGGAATA